MTRLCKQVSQSPAATVMASGLKSPGRAGFRFGGFLLAILRRTRSFKSGEKARRDAGDFVHGSLEGGFVGPRRLVKSADLPHKLERSGADLLVGDGWIEVE
jgi:hypothetical protein